MWRTDWYVWRWCIEPTPHSIRQQPPILHREYFAGWTNNHLVSTRRTGGESAEAERPFTNQEGMRSGSRI